MSLAAIAATRPLLASEAADPGGIIYIDTEATFQVSRLQEVLVARYPALYDARVAGRDLAASTMRRAMCHVVLHQPHSLSDLVSVAAALEEEVIEHRVQLIVVDSVAAAARRGMDPSRPWDTASRVEQLVRLSSLLKGLADTFRIPVVCVNQVTTAVRRGEAGGGGEGALDEELRPALGPTWAHCVNTRLFLHRPSRPEANDRQVTIMKSSVAPNATFPFSIATAGLCPPESGYH